jgi:hypothetical protein
VFKRAFYVLFHDGKSTLSIHFLLYKKLPIKERIYLFSILWVKPTMDLVLGHIKYKDNRKSKIYPG